MRVRHEFESFYPIAKKYFLRAYYWTKLYARRKKFDPVATTLQEALTTISGVGVVLGLISLIGPMSLIRPLWVLCILIHCYLVRKFLSFAYHEKGLVFAVKSFFYGACSLLFYIRRCYRRTTDVYKIKTHTVCIFVLLIAY